MNKLAPSLSILVLFAIGIMADGFSSAAANQDGFEANIEFECPESSPWSDVSIRDFLEVIAQSEFETLQDVNDARDPSDGAQVLEDPQDSSICAELNHAFASSLAQKEPSSAASTPLYSNDVVYYHVGPYVVVVMFEKPGRNSARTPAEFRQNPLYHVAIYDNSLNGVYTLSSLGQ